MKKVINEKIISIPPFISTSWNNVSALHMKGTILAITLIDGTTINIPGLAPDVIESIFNYHTLFLEKETLPEKLTSGSGKLSFEGIELPFRLGIGAMEGLGAAMQHNPAQANAPDLPQEILQKISSIAKILAPDENIILPKAEPNCNCVHCQIARALNPQLQQQEVNHEEEISDADLHFQQWDITQTGDKLYTVINRLDTKEKYSVYLGHPIGCTCGKQGCEHILAVLKS